ncbi:MAG TPA: Ig-like domain-containing protein [Mycobacterium sp.]|mgnify:FL=1|nr:Ig-like domain-containing protein [Mycobacterium sp.]HPZ95162.1 Ig-like domain-containing protein [Mycobacterium sp.]HQE15575.1 Ig-like domain-containing protein [Mycobacterium sp.]
MSTRRRQITGTTLAAGAGWAVLSAATGMVAAFVSGAAVASADSADEGSPDAVRSAEKPSRGTAASREPAASRAFGPGSRPTGATAAARGPKVSPPAVRRVSAAGPSAVAQSQAAPGSSLRAAATRTDPLTALLANSAPRPVAVQTGQAPGGIVSGSLDSLDDDGDPVGLAVTRAPANGTVTLTPSGHYTYTADPLLAHSDSVDSFQVTASDAGGGFHLHGLEGLLNLLPLGLVGSAGHTATTTVRVTVSAFNNAPSATLRVDPPDPVTGVLTGRILGSDPNDDTLTYLASSAPVKGAVTLTAAGEFTYSPSAEALAVASAPTATAADRRDEFTVSIEDGYGGSVVVPVAFTFVAGAPSRELSTFCGCTLMPADTVFHADVSALPVLATSQTWTDLIGGTLIARWQTTPWMGSSAGMPVNVVDADHPTETVIFNRGYSTTGPNIDDSPYAIPDFPLVEGMPDVPAWDRHLLVFQKGTCISQELINVANGVELPAAGILDAAGNAAYAALWGSTWIAEAGVHYDMNSPLYPAIGAANASKLPYLPLILRPDDLERGEIDHMLGIVIAKDRGTGHAWPARAGDGTGTNPDGVPMGTVFRLRADFDITDYDPATQVVLRALQRHGAVIYDSFGEGRDGAGLLAMGNGWTGTDHLTAQRELSTIPISAFEAVDVLSLAVDPSVGWQIRT